MKAIRKIVEGNVLNQVIDLPVEMQNTLVEIVIAPVEKSINTTLSRSELRAKLPGSHTQMLTGVLPSSAEITIAELRKERRMKYEHTY